MQPVTAPLLCVRVGLLTVVLTGVCTVRVIRSWGFSFALGSVLTTIEGPKACPLRLSQLCCPADGLHFLAH